MAYLTAEEARKKADTSYSQYQILQRAVFAKIEYAAHEGTYRLITTEETDYSLAVRLAEELRSCGYWVDYCKTYPIATDTPIKSVTFNISWKI